MLPQLENEEAKEKKVKETAHTEWLPGVETRHPVPWPCAVCGEDWKG